MKNFILVLFLLCNCVNSFSQSDVGVTGILHPKPNLCTGDSVKIKIKNYGAAAVNNIPIEIKITGVVTATLNNIFVSNIPAGGEDSINVGAVVSGANGFLSIRAYTLLAGDVNINNDTFLGFATMAPTPTVNAFASDSVCLGVGFALTGNGASTYLWSGGSIPSPSVANPYVHAPAVGTYTYQLVGTNAYGCKGYASKMVKINPLPVITTVGDTSCPGDLAQISASGGINYNWGTFGNTASINVNPTNTTNYTVTVTSSLNCSATATTFVMVRPKPLISVQNDSICITEIAKLQAFGGVSYNWGAFGTADTIAVSPIITTNYPVTVTDAFNCTNSTNATAFIRPNPTIICLVDSLCSGQTARIDAKGAFFYNWGSLLGTNSYAFVSPLINTNYSVTGTDIYGCTGVGTASVIMKPGITVNAIGDTACKGDDVTVSVINPSGLNSYNWGTLGAGPELTFKSTVTNSYRVMATAPNGCTAEATAFVLVENKPSLNISITKNVLCLGESSMLLAGIPSGGIMSGKGVFNSQLYPDSAGVGTHIIKYVYVTPNAGCTDTFTRNIRVAKCTNEIQGITGIEKVITFPNPFDNMFQVIIKGATEGKTTITLLDLNGRIMEKKEMMLNPTADNAVLFETAHLSQGMYQVRIIKNDEAFVLNVLKQ